MTVSKVVTSAIEIAERGRRETGQLGTNRAPQAGVVRRGVVTAVNANGTYGVGVFDGSGGTAQALDQIVYWGAGTLSVGDRVLLFYEDPRPMPYIGATGAGGSSSIGESIATPLLGFLSE